MSKSLNPICGIYKIENTINGKVYIGQSDDITRRIKDHKNQLKKNIHHNNHLQRAVNMYGIDNFSFDLLEECDVSELDEKEMMYIEQYDSYNSGYNNTLGGDGNKGFVPSEETREKMRRNHADMSGENNPMYGKKMRDVMGDEAYEAFIKRTYNARLEAAKRRRGTKMSEEARQKLSASRKAYYLTHEPRTGFHFSEESKRKISISNKIRHAENPELYFTRPVVLLNTGACYDSISSASKECGVSASAITTCCNGKNLSAGKLDSGEKLVWVYESDYINMNHDEIAFAIDRAARANCGKNKPNARAVMCVETGQVFDTVTDAGNNMHIDISSISKCCRGKMHFAGKDPVSQTPYHWRFV